MTLLFVFVWTGVIYFLMTWITDLALKPLVQPLDAFYGAKKSHPGHLGLPFKDITHITTDGVTLKAWLIPGTTVLPNSKLCILSHGHMGNRAQLLELLPWIRQLDYDIFLSDLRHHGQSGGTQFTFGYRESEDLLEFVQLLEHMGYRRNSMVGFGLSIGAVVTLRAQALANPFAAIILDSCSSDVRETVADFGSIFFGFPRSLSRVGIVAAQFRARVDLDAMAGTSDAARVKSPVLLIHGGKDDRIPSYHSDRLLKAFGSIAELEIIEDAGHAVSFFVDPTRYKKRVENFLGKLSM